MVGNDDNSLGKPRHYVVFRRADHKNNHSRRRQIGWDVVLYYTFLAITATVSQPLLIRGDSLVYPNRAESLPAYIKAR
jgi:hypothetical protein